MANIVQESIYYMVPFPFDFLNFLRKLFAYSLFFRWGGRDLCELTDLFFFFLKNSNFHFSPIGATYWIMLVEVELWCKTHKKSFILI